MPGLYARGRRAEQAFDRAAERWWVDGRIPAQLRLDAREVLPHRDRIDQPSRRHLAHVNKILAMASLDFRQGLRIRIEVMKAGSSLLRDEWTAILPSRADGDEVDGRSELDVDLQGLFDAGDGAEQLVGFGHLDIGLSLTFAGQR